MNRATIFISLSMVLVADGGMGALAGQATSPNAYVDEDSVALQRVLEGDYPQPTAELYPLYALDMQFRNRKDWTNELSVIHLVVKIWSETAGKNAVGTARFEDREAVILMLLGRYGEAEALLRQCLDNFHHAKNVDTAARSLVASHLAEALANTGKLNEASSLYEQALSAMESAVGFQDPWLAIARKYETVLTTSRDDARLAALQASEAKHQQTPKAWEGGHNPNLLKKREPTYTSRARSARLGGTISLWITINADGNTFNIHVLEPLGLGLDEKAVKAVSGWRFEPGTNNGTPTAWSARVEVNFRLL